MCRKKQYAPENEKIVMHASNFRPVKRTTDVVRIFHKILEKTPAKLLLIGEGPDRILVQQVIRDLGIQNHVTFMGQVDYIDDLLQCADIFLLPSEQESFGLAALEAMNCSVPVIGAQTGGMGEVIVNGETGFIFPVGEITAMADAAIDLLRNPQKHKRFRENARQRAMKTFGTDVIMPKWLQFYERILQKN
ncbi:MAG: glycosyltransferase [Calditrichaeota bacterium]|nr:MAG: glycosyltransferase [Calditrichota bacterium]